MMTKNDQAHGIIIKTSRFYITPNLLIIVNTTSKQRTITILSSYTSYNPWNTTIGNLPESIYFPHHIPTIDLHHHSSFTHTFSSSYTHIESDHDNPNKLNRETYTTRSSFQRFDFTLIPNSTHTNPNANTDSLTRSPPSGHSKNVFTKTYHTTTLNPPHSTMIRNDYRRIMNTYHNQKRDRSSHSAPIICHITIIDLVSTMPRSHWITMVHFPSRTSSRNLQ